VYGYSLGDCIPNNEFDILAVDSRFNFRLDAKELVVNVSVKKQSPQIAAALTRDLESTFRLYAARSGTALRQKIIENTTFRTENDQVFIVTRFPRAGLNSLLGLNAR
ncbi:MAG: hypothetical protein ABR577_20250, partial [Pyrinomonadaceae bacterium]